MTDVALRTAETLTGDEREAWQALQSASPLTAGPYFSLGFFDAVAAVRADTRVIVRRKAGAPVGFLALQIGAFGHARPLGGPLGDHHGVIGDMGDAQGVTHALRRTGVNVFDFHGALAGQSAFMECSGEREGSWVVDLSAGAQAWRDRRKKPGGNTLRTILVSERKLTERHGPVEFEFDDRSPEALEALYAWKSDQYRRSGHFDVFSARWTRALVQRLLAADAACGARGLVSTLKVDGALAAVHFGMMGGGVMHYWFPAYDPAYQKEGSGNALQMRLFSALADQGVSEVHLGPGEYRYKAALADWQFPIVRGYLGHGPVAAVRALASRTEALGAQIQRGPFRDLPGRAFRRIDLITGFRAA